MAMTLRLTAEQDRALTLLAQAQGSSKQEAAIRAIVSTAARTLADNQVREIATEVLDDYLVMQSRLERGNS
ncbi:CopG family transcriptional regulator [Corynebacterium sp. ZY180755]